MKCKVSSGSGPVVGKGCCFSFYPIDAMLPWYMSWLVSVFLSVCLSQVEVLSKCLNISSRTMAQGLYFSDAKDLDEIPMVSPPTGSQNGENCVF